MAWNEEWVELRPGWLGEKGLWKVEHEALSSGREVSENELVTYVAEPNPPSAIFVSSSRFRAFLCILVMYATTASRDIEKHSQLLFTLFNCLPFSFTNCLKRSSLDCSVFLQEI